MCQTNCQLAVVEMRDYFIVMRLWEREATRALRFFVDEKWFEKHFRIVNKGDGDPPFSWRNKMHTNPAIG